jgi:3D (Asp-Asp-Asp) domain-containing protein
MILIRSVRWKVLVTAIAACGFVALYEATMLEPQNLAWLGPVIGESVEPPFPGVRLSFSATAYCKGMVTTAGVAAQAGVAASDPSVLPIGSVVQIGAPELSYDGIYSILDTGPAIQGRQVDLYMWNCNEALRFGRRPIRLTVLRLGWNPKASAPSFMDRLLGRPDTSPQPGPLPSRPIPSGN